MPAPVATGVPIDPKALSDAVNPDAKAAYSGPTGVAEGRIVVTGDPPTDLTEIASAIKPECESARPFYGKLFREGPGRSLADVLVAVTGYHEYIPAREPARRFVAKDCMFPTRTIALTFGQRIEVVSGDKQAYVPELVGERGQAQIIATPGTDVASLLYPTRPGRFMLIDNLRLFMIAEVLVLKYATMQVTGIDGRYRIEGLPPGLLNLSAVLPVTGKVVEKPITIEAGKTVVTDLSIPFDAKAYEKERAAIRAHDAGAPPGDAGAAPSGAVAKRPAPAASGRP
ncbi:MAG TPA: carboxypeptidase-like regulatory domain-containing protein [Polyangiaceae bacterium]